jgi:hypothetical protein
MYAEHENETSPHASRGGTRRFDRPAGWPLPNPARAFFGRPTPVPSSWALLRESDQLAALRTRLV